MLVIEAIMDVLRMHGSPNPETPEGKLMKRARKDVHDMLTKHYGFQKVFCIGASQLDWYARMWAIGYGTAVNERMPQSDSSPLSEDK